MITVAILYTIGVTTVRIFLQTNVIFLLILPLLMGGSMIEQNVQPPTEEETSIHDQDRLATMEQSEKQKIIFHGSPKRKKIAITFDDGPDLDYTVKILNILSEHHVPATFFVLGKSVKKYPKIVQRMFREGHTVGNHSWDHVDFTQLSTQEIQQQIERTSREISYWTGKKPLFFRPPFGAINPLIVDQVSQKGYSVIYWSVDTKDWKGKSSEKILQIVNQKTQPGSIILFHSAGGIGSLDGTVKVLPQIIFLLQNKGYQFVTVDQLIDLPAYSQD